MILNNGARLITAPIYGTEAATILILFKVGSRYESKNINGVSHFIEHMMFKGTTKRPNTFVISKELDSVGALYNAFTSRDHTGYFVKINSEKIETALDILSDILFNSKFEAQEIEREKGVISEEIRMYEDNPIMFIEDIFEQTLFGNHPLGQRISGTVETIKKFNREQILKYKNYFYQPKNMVIGLAGKIGKKDKSLIQKYFGQKGISIKPKFSKFYFLRSKKPKFNLLYRETEQVQLALGFPGYSYFNSKIYALTLLSVILGGTMSSRLFISIRERQGLCYFIKSFLNVYEDTGNLVIQSGLDKSRIKEAIRAILDELNKIKKEGVTEEELKRAKECIKGRLILDLEDSSEVANWYAKQELLIGKILTPEEKLKKIFAVTPAAIQRVAADVIKTKNLCAAIIGPFKDKKPFIKLLQ
jgi:predicted Zn-dependent peptidase